MRWEAKFIFRVAVKWKVAARKKTDQVFKMLGANFSTKYVEIHKIQIFWHTTDTNKTGHIDDRL